MTSRLSSDQTRKIEQIREMLHEAEIAESDSETMRLINTSARMLREIASEIESKQSIFKLLF